MGTKFIQLRIDDVFYTLDTESNIPSIIRLRITGVQRWETGIDVYYEKIGVKDDKFCYVYIERGSLYADTVDRFTTSKKEIKSMLRKVCYERLDELAEEHNAKVEALYSAMADSEIW